MNNILRLSIANIRKNKSQAISLFAFVLIAALLLNTGLVLFTGLDAYVIQRAEAAHAPHFTAIFETGSDSIDEGERFMQNHPDVIEIERLELAGGHGQILQHDIEINCVSVFSRIDNSQTMDRPKLIGDSLPLSDSGIYIPYLVFDSGGHSLGDEFFVEAFGVPLSFTIAGVTEEMSFGTIMNATLRFYVSDSRFEEIKNSFPNVGITLLSARLNDRNESLDFSAEFSRKVSSTGLYWYSLMDFAVSSRTMIPTIVIIVITAIALVLMIVSLIVIRFRIVNSIEEGMTNIGAQKAVGYRSIQIVSSIVLQFGLIAIVGCISGVLLSLFTSPLVTGIFTPMMGLTWTPEPDLAIALITIISITFAVAIISYLTSRRINKLHPLIALRGGLATHNFKKNPLPLEKSAASITLLLALKHFFQNKKQAVTVAIIFALITLSSVIGVVANHSMNEGSEDFARSVFGEISDAGFMLANDEETEGFIERMENHPDVRKVLAYSFSPIMMLIDEVSVVILGVEDSSKLEGGMLVSGRYPIHDNEVAFGTPLLRILGKSTGDTIAIEFEGNTQDFLITGVVQFMNGNGINGLMTSDGIRRLHSDFILASVSVYLNSGVDVQNFIDNVTDKEDIVFNMVINMFIQMETSMAGIGGIFTAVAIGIISITVFVIILTLFMVLRTVILRRRRELGIQKAVGFTTLQLMNQIALNIMPTAIIGIVVGAIAGYIGFNPMMMGFTASMGIAKLNLPIVFSHVIIICLALSALTYIVSMLIAVRIRKISAYALVTE